jgi:hypothetical protein
MHTPSPTTYIHIRVLLHRRQTHRSPIMTPRQTSRTCNCRKQIQGFNPPVRHPMLPKGVELGRRTRAGALHNRRCNHHAKGAFASRVILHLPKMGLGPLAIHRQNERPSLAVREGTRDHGFDSLCCFNQKKPAHGCTKTRDESSNHLGTTRAQTMLHDTGITTLLINTIYMYTCELINLSSTAASRLC